MGKPPHSVQAVSAPFTSKLQLARGTAADDREEKLREVEQQIAYATANDNADARERLWTRYVWADPIGIVLTRAQGVAMIRSGQVKPERYTINKEARPRL